MTNTSDPDQHHTGTGQTLPIRFTASGRDYARLWLRNLGLTLITLGLYLPFARAHRLRFFRQHTQVDGEALVDVLLRFFPLNLENATQIMLHVHTRGRGVCGVFTREIAESKVAQVNEYSRLNQHPLLCTMEKA